MSKADDAFHSDLQVESVRPPTRDESSYELSVRKDNTRMLGADAPLFIIILFPLDNEMM